MINITLIVLEDEIYKPVIKCIPLLNCWRGISHIAKEFKFIQSSFSKGSYFSIFIFRKAFGGSNKIYPIFVYAIAVTNQNADPIIDEDSKSFLRPVRMNHEEGNGCIDHGP